PPRPDSGFMAYWLGYPTDSSADPLKISALLFKHPLVAWAQPDEIGNARPSSVPTDPYFPLQYYLKNTNLHNGIPVDDNVEPAWDLTRGAGIPSEGGITIAIIDDGVQASHPEFHDVDGSRVEFGYDVFGNTTLDCDSCANNPSLEQHHGTAVAGIAAAQQDNGQGITGVAPEALIRRTPCPAPMGRLSTWQPVRRGPPPTVESRRVCLCLTHAPRSSSRQFACTGGRRTFCSRVSSRHSNSILSLTCEPASAGSTVSRMAALSRKWRLLGIGT